MLENALKMVEFDNGKSFGGTQLLVFGQVLDKLKMIRDGLTDIAIPLSRVAKKTQYLLLVCVVTTLETPTMQDNSCAHAAHVSTAEKTL